jgi:hypothetical protein
MRIQQLKSAAVEDVAELLALCYQCAEATPALQQKQADTTPTDPPAWYAADPSLPGLLGHGALAHTFYGAGAGAALGAVSTALTPKDRRKRWVRNIMTGMLAGGAAGLGGGQLGSGLHRLMSATSDDGRSHDSLVRDLSSGKKKIVAPGSTAAGQKDSWSAKAKTVGEDVVAGLPAVPEKIYENVVAKPLSAFTGKNQYDSTANKYFAAGAAGFGADRLLDHYRAGRPTNIWRGVHDTIDTKGADKLFPDLKTTPDGVLPSVTIGPPKPGQNKLDQARLESARAAISKLHQQYPTVPSQFTRLPFGGGARRDFDRQYKGILASHPEQAASLRQVGKQYLKSTGKIGGGVRMLRGPVIGVGVAGIVDAAREINERGTAIDDQGRTLADRLAERYSAYNQP